VKALCGDPDAAIQHVMRAMRLSPVDPRSFQWQTATALAHLCADHYDVAALWAERALRDQPGFASALRLGAASHVHAGRLAEAQKLTSRLRECYPGLRLSNLAEVIPRFRRAEDRARIVEGLRKAGLPE
jgi:hypothetical protein